MGLNKNLLVIIRLIVVLILTINATNFELYPSLDRYLNYNVFTQVASLFALCLTFAISLDRVVVIDDIFNAVAATLLFMLIARPIAQRYKAKHYVRKGYIDDVVNHGWLEGRGTHPLNMHGLINVF